LSADSNLAPQQDGQEKRFRPGKAFQRLWVAGTLGAFFTALARSFPVDVRRLVYSFDGAFALNALIRYAYMLWLIWYFFLSNLSRQADEKPRKYEIAFDVIQSLGGLTAAFYLDFLVQHEPHGVRAYMAPNLVIVVICLFAAIWFPADTALQNPRWAGALVAFVSAAGAYFLPYGPWCMVGVLIVPLAVLVWLLVRFHQVRLSESIASNRTNFIPVWVDGTTLDKSVLSQKDSSIELSGSLIIKGEGNGVIFADRTKQTTASGTVVKVDNK
jgi:hypothetical protein